MEQIILDTLMKKKLSHVDNRYEFRLSDSILVRADVGEYGPYVRIKQHDMWIVLSVKAWNFMCQQMDIISKALTAKTSFGTTFGATKGLRVSYVNGSPTVMFEENKTVAGKNYNKVLSMNTGEWENLVCLSSAVTDVLNDVVAYSAADGHEEWHFMKDACDAFKLRYRLVPKLANNVITSLIHGYIVSCAIEKTVHKMCYGCQVNHPCQVQHMNYGSGCLALWGEMVECHYDNCKDKVDIQSAVTKVNTHMKWELEASSPDADALRQLVLDMNQITGTVACVYKQMLEDIGLNNCMLND